ncbi:MAG: AsmA family protein [Chitinispirillia bacterium]|jgi:uncharacterized protein involved in outer membrane biogenesis
MSNKSSVTIVLYVLIGLIILAAITVGVLILMFPPDKIKAMVIPQIEKVLDRKVTVEGAGLSLYPVLGVSLSELGISNTEREGFSDEQFVKVGKFLIQISVPSLFRGKPEISKIVIKKPSILLEIDRHGSFNYSDLAMLKSDSTVKKAEKKSSGMPMLPIPISLKNFIIENGSITYIDKKSGQEFIIGDFNQQVAFSIDKELRDVSTDGNFVLSNISVKDKSITKPLKNLNVTLSHQIHADIVKGDVKIEELRLSFQKIFLNTTGTISGLNDTPLFNLVIHSDPIEVNDLLAEIPVEVVPALKNLTASGILDLNLNINGSFIENGKLPVKGSLKINNCTIKYSDLPKSINNINASVNFTDTDLHIEKMQLKFGDNPVSLKAVISNFKKPFIDLALKAQVNLDDIEDIMKLPDGAAVSGDVDMNIEARGEIDPSDPAKLDLKGRSDLKNVAVLWPPLLKPAVVNGNFNLSSKAIGENLSVAIGSSSLSMDASVANYLSLVLPDSTKNFPRPNAEFTLKSSMLNVDEFLPPSKDTAKNEDPSIPVSDKNSPLIAPLPGVDMKGILRAKKIIYLGIEMDNCIMNIKVLNDIADMNIKTGFSRGIIEDIVHADLRNTQNINFTNTLKVSNIQVAELLDRFGKFIKPSTPLNRELINLQKSLSGAIHLNSKIKGNGGTSEEISKSIAGNVDLKVSDGKISNSLITKRISGVTEKFFRLEDVTFRNLKAKLEIANEQVSFEQCDIQANNAGDWSILGKVGFDASLALKTHARLTKSTSQKALALQSKGKDALKGLISGTALAGAANLIDNTGIPSDNEGRITLILGLDGTVSDPKPRFLGFGEGNKGKSAQATPSVKQQIKDKVQAAVDAKKKELEAKLAEERKKAEALAKKKLEEQKIAEEAKKVLENEKAKKKAKELKEKVGSKLKKLF